MRKTIVVLVLIVVGLAVAEDGARYLVITADALYTSILPLAQWQHATGLSTRVVKLSQIGGDTTSIKNYIKNAWNTWPVRPEYVLIVGAGEFVPARRHTVQGGWGYYSDNIYGDMTGDVESEIAVGRLPAKNAAQLDVMVAKTLVYERTPDITDTLWMRRLTTIVREGSDMDDTIYWNNARRAAGQAATAGFVRCDSLSYLRGHTASNVVTSINAGCGIVMYRGTAGGNWYMPFDVNPAQTANGRMLPIVCSFTCETMTLAPGETMVGDAWLKTGTVGTPSGAVAFFGNTHSASNVARLRGAVCRGFFDGLFGENAYRLGYTALRARHQLRLEYPSYTSDYRGFNLFGDPALAVWTATPQRLDVSHPTSIEPGSQVLHVTVSHAAQPVNGALVCASMAADTTVYAYARTDEVGEVFLNIAPGDTGRLRLVVTGQNLYPYDTIMPVNYTAVAEPDRTGPSRGDRIEAAPAVFAASTRLTWNGSSDASIVVYSAAGHEVSTAAAGTAHTWDGRDRTGRTLPAGVYLAVAEDSRGCTLAATRLVKVR